MQSTNRYGFFFVLIIAFAMAKPSVASPVFKAKCESLKKIKSQSQDELCQELLEAAEMCFAKVNLQFVKVKKKVSSSESGRAEPAERKSLQKKYKSAIRLVESYYPELDKRKCHLKKSAMEIVVKELKKDYRLVNLDLWK